MSMTKQINPIVVIPLLDSVTETSAVSKPKKPRQKSIKKAKVTDQSIPVKKQAKQSTKNWVCVPTEANDVMVTTVIELLTAMTDGRIKIKSDEDAIKQLYKSFLNSASRQRT
jgi:hypothetical protein